MPNYEDDDLDRPAVATKNATTSEAVIDTDDLDVDFGDQDAMSNTDGLERIQPADKGSKVRVALLTDVVKPKMAWMHFIENSEGKKVSYRCQSKRDKKHVMLEMADCCKKLNNDDNQKAQLNFAVLALKYTNADPKTGKYISADNKTGKNESAETTNADTKTSTEIPIRYEIGWLKLSRSGFKTISELVEEDEQVTAFDFTVGHRENKIGYDYRKVARRARFRLNPELLAEVLKEAAKFADGQLLAKRLGKVVSALDMKAVLSGGKAGAKGSQIDNVDDL